MPRDFVTVVTGAPRSGTSLLMQVLEAGGISALSDGVRTPDASNPRGYLEHRWGLALGRDPRAVAWLRSARGRALKVVVAQLAALPEEIPLRVLVASRSPADVAGSQAAMLARTGGEAGGSAQTPSPLA